MRRAHLASTAGSVVLALCVLATSARAQWTVHADAEYFTWREHTEPIEVEETGPRYAFGGRWLQRKGEGVLVGALARFYAGSVDYDGSFQFDATIAARGTTSYVGGAVAGEVRYRWPEIIDGIVGIEYEQWRRELSQQQHEDYDIVSLRLGVDRSGVTTSPFVFSGGVRLLLATHETATIVSEGFRYDLELEPGLGANPYVEAGVHATSRVTLTVYWDGMDLGRSNTVTLIKEGEPAATVSQPPSDMDVIGLRVSYGW